MRQQATFRADRSNFCGDMAYFRFLANVNSRSRSLYVIAVPSVCLSVTFMRTTQPVKMFGNFFRRLVPWPSVDIHGKFYGDRPGRTPPSGV